MNDMRSLLSPSQRSSLESRYPKEIAPSHPVPPPSRPRGNSPPHGGGGGGGGETGPPINDCYMAPLSKLSNAELINAYIVRNEMGGNMGENSTNLQLPTR